MKEVTITENVDIEDYTNKIMNLVDELAIENLLWILRMIWVAIKDDLDKQ